MLSFDTGGALAADPDAAPSVPYVAYVTKRAAIARSGPELSDYPTDALLQGERVTVREVRGDWLAIEAPAESFSWVPGERLKLSADGKSAEVLQDDVPAWVGSHINAVDGHTAQVKLRRGERVNVLGQRDLPGGPQGGQVWVKIAPPAGERRWIPAAAVSREPPSEPPPVPPAESAEAQAESVESAARVEPGDTAAGWTDRTTGISRRRGAGWEEESAADRSYERGRRSAKTDALPGGPSDDVTVGNWTHLLDYPTSTSFHDRLARLQLALSRAVAGGGTTAQLDLLEQRAEELIRSGTNSYERGQATLLLDGIREFRQLARRRKASVQRASYGGPGADIAIGTGIRSDSGPTTALGLLEKLATEVQGLSGANGGVGSEATGAAGRLVGKSPYLAEGWLMPVSSPARAAPPYVLMDDEGHPVAFVTPAPGVNLRRYVDKQVGIMGQPAFEVLDRQHVVAHRAIDLSRHRDDARISRSASPWIRNREPEPVGVLR